MSWKRYQTCSFYGCLHLLQHSQRLSAGVQSETGQSSTSAQHQHCGNFRIVQSSNPIWFPKTYRVGKSKKPVPYKLIDDSS